MHRAGIVADADRCAADQRRKLEQCRFAGEVDGAGRKLGDLLAQRTLAIGPDQGDGKLLFSEMPRHLGETVAPPLFGVPIGARRHRDERLGFADIVVVQQRIDAGRGFLRDRERKIGCAGIEAKERRRAEVALLPDADRASATGCDRYKQASCLRAHPARRAAWPRPEFFAPAFATRPCAACQSRCAPARRTAKAKTALRNWPCRSSTRS